MTHHVTLGIAALALVTALASPATAFDHGPFDQLLRSHVRRGRVDYSGIRRQRKAALDAYVQAVAKANLKGLGRRQRLAFYLNAYNALVIKAVIDRGPALKNVRKVKGFFDGIRHRVAGRSLTLNDLENKVIRPRFKEPRIHFGLVCAARSCPPLHAAAYTGKNVTRILERQTRAFINSSAGVQVTGTQVKVSQLFKWYAEDFVAAAGSVGAYLAKYHKQHGGQLAKSTKLGYLHYDWTLNGR